MSMRSKYNKVKAFLHGLLPVEVRYWLLEREMRKLEEELGPLPPHTVFLCTEPERQTVDASQDGSSKDLN